MNVCVLVFSKDRAMQLDAALGSFDRHVSVSLDAQGVDRVVLYTTTSEMHASHYDTLQRQYRNWRFVRQGASFQDDVRRIIKPSNHVLFAVDDAMFVRNFDLPAAIRVLDSTPGTIGVSLRLGRNITYCYPVDKTIPPVLLHTVETGPLNGVGMLIYPWPGEAYDFAYPMEVSSSLYRTADLQPVLDRASFAHPNALESAMDAYKGVLAAQYPSLLCFEQSVAFCAPMNMVQTVVKNRSATSQGYSAEALAQRFEAGERIDVAKFADFVPRGCHQEVELLPTLAKPDTNPAVDRLNMLKGAYIGLADHSFWQDFGATIDVQQFRGESHYISQLAYGATREQYREVYDYVRRRHGKLLAELDEDGDFGCLTFNFDGKTVSRDMLDSILEVSFIDEMLGLSKERTILDIGAGYGRLAHRLLELFPVSRVHCYDAVPISTVLSEIYLQHRGVDDRAKVVPLHQLEELTPASIDLACNVHSWSECTLKSINFWLDFLADHDVPNLFVVPHNESFLTRERSGAPASFLPAIVAHGFTLERETKKYPDGVRGAFPTSYYWFKRHTRTALRPEKPKTSLTSATHGDNAYLDVCERASAPEDDSVFSIFKSLPAYKAVLEHVSYEQGLGYLKEIDLSQDDLAALAVNDTYGSPATYEYPAGRISPTTLRYAKVACDLRKHFDSIRSIAEIGVGYGGQQLVLSKLTPTDAYYAIDLPPVLRLADKYLMRVNRGLHGATLVDATDAAAVAGVPAADLVISNYAFSECTMTVRDMYVDTVIRKAKYVYMTINHMDDAEIMALRTQLIAQGKEVVVLPEVPRTAEGNCILIGRPAETTRAAAPTTFHSQAGQDRFVHALLGGEGGRRTFLDVGCSDPVLLSNTLALESIGWKGVLFDINPDLKTAIAEKRTSPFVCGDVKNAEWGTILDAHKMPSVIDYLSFDLDEAGEAILPTLPWSRVRFRVLTVEHDAYRFGDHVRHTMRKFLRSQGYELLCPDVTNAGTPFEDWWVDPLLIDMALAERLRTTTPTEGLYITSSERTRPSAPAAVASATSKIMPDFTVAMAVPLSKWAPERVASSEQLRRQLTPLPSWVTQDTIVSHERTHMAVWFRKVVDTLLQRNATYSLLIQDDARVAPDFWTHLQRMLTAKPDKVISLYTIHPGAQKAFDAGLRWCASMDIIPGVAWVLPTQILRDMRRWEETALRPGYEARMPEDGRLGLYCAANNIPIWQPLPTIVDHRAPDAGIVSTYGNDELAHRNASFTWKHMPMPDHWGGRALWCGRGFIETPLFFARNVREWDEETMTHIENGSHPALRGAPALDLVPRPDLPDVATTSSRS